MVEAGAPQETQRLRRRCERRRCRPTWRALSLYEIDVRDELFDEADDAPQSLAFIADGEHFLLEVNIQWKRPGNPEGQVPRR